MPDRGIECKQIVILKEHCKRRVRKAAEAALGVCLRFPGFVVLIDDVVECFLRNKCDLKQIVTREAVGFLELLVRIFVQSRDGDVEPFAILVCVSPKFGSNSSTNFDDIGFFSI